MTDIDELSQQISRLEGRISGELRAVAVATRDASGSLLVRMKNLESQLDHAIKAVDQLNESLEVVSREMSLLRNTYSA